MNIINKDAGMAALIDELKGRRGGMIVVVMGLGLSLVGCIATIGATSATGPGNQASALLGLFACATGALVLVGLVIAGLGAVLGLAKTATLPPEPAPEPSMETTGKPAMTAQDRHAILQIEIDKYLKQGYRVISQTDTTAQLVRPKTFSCLLAVLLLIFTMGLILLLYLFYYLAKRDQTIYIEVDERGRVKRR